MAPRKRPVIQQTLWRCNDGHLTTPDGYVFSGCESLQLANLMRLCYADIVQAARKEQRSLEKSADIRNVKWDTKQLPV